MRASLSLFLPLLVRSLTTPAAVADLSPSHSHSASPAQPHAEFGRLDVNANVNVYVKNISGEVYVSLLGNDTTADGSREFPFATVTAALLFLFDINFDHPTRASVIFEDGVYYESLFPDDRGTIELPWEGDGLSFKAARGEESDVTLVLTHPGSADVGTVFIESEKKTVEFNGIWLNGMWVLEGGTNLIITNCTMFGESSFITGITQRGAFFWNFISFKVTNNNAAAAIQVSGGGSGWILIINSTFENSTYKYGSVYVFGNAPELRVMGSRFVGNRCQIQGCGLFIRASIGKVYINNSIFDHNTASALSGGAVSVLASLTGISNSTFSNNRAAVAGGGAVHIIGDSWIRDCSFANNSGSDMGSAIALQNGGKNSTSFLSNSSFTCNFWRKGEGQPSDMFYSRPPISNEAGCQIVVENSTLQDARCPTICDRGYTTDDPYFNCKACTPGRVFVYDDPYIGTCKACTPGRYTVSEAATQCSPCPPGQYNNITMATECSLCPKGTYQEFVGQLSCLTCGAGSKVLSYDEPTACLACPQGWYNQDPGQDQCHLCTKFFRTSYSGARACDRIRTEAVYVVLGILFMVAIVVIPCARMRYKRWKKKKEDYQEIGNNVYSTEFGASHNHQNSHHHHQRPHTPNNNNTFTQHSGRHQQQQQQHYGQE